jgi:hypothetical protein
LAFFYILTFSACLETGTSDFLSSITAFLGAFSLIFFTFCSTGFYFFSSLALTTLLVFFSLGVGLTSTFLAVYLGVDLSVLSVLSVELAFLVIVCNGILDFCCVSFGVGEGVVAASVTARQSKRMNATNTLRFISNLLLNIGCLYVYRRWTAVRSG